MWMCLLQKVKKDSIQTALYIIAQVLGGPVFMKFGMNVKELEDTPTALCT